MFRSPRSRRPAARAAGGIQARVRAAPRRAAAAAVALTLTLSLAACAGGAIGQATPVSNGTSFVSGGPGATFFKAGGRQAAPDVKGTSLTGQKLALASYRGSVVVLNFWGSWCGPCRAEAPSLAALAARFQASGARFVGVDIRDNPASAEAFGRSFRISYPSLNDPGDEIALQFRGTVPPLGIPTTLVIDRRGGIAARIVGPVSYDGLKTLITQIAAGSS